MKPNDVLPVPCAAWAEKLAAQPADLTKEERAALAGHILTCSACASVQAAYRTMDASILALPPVAALVEMPRLDGVERELQATEDRHKAPASSPQLPPVPTGREGRVGARVIVPERRQSRRWVGVVSGVAAVLVVGALLSGFLLLFGARHTLVGGNAGAQTIFAASDEDDGTVYAVRPSDGALYWQHSIGQKLTGALVASSDTLYVGAYDNHVYALRKSDGSLRWTSPVSIGDASSPTFADNTAVYVSSTSAIYALSVKDGHLLWSRPAPQCNTCVAEFIAIDGGTLYAYLDGLYALRASDGKILWHDPQFSFSNRSFALIDGKIYVPGGRSGILYELRASDGKQLKTLTFQQGEPLEMVAGGGVIYVDSAGHDVYAIRASDDATLWHKQFDDLRLGLTGPDDGAIYFAQNITSVGSTQTNANDSYALNTNNGSPRRGSSPSIIVSSVPGFDGIVYLFPRSSIYVLNTNNGLQRWNWSPSPFIAVSPVTGFNGVAYFFSGNAIYALNASNGKQLWQVSEGDRLNSLIIG